MCGDLAASARREWIVTNGRGGYAAGTVAGLLSRRYHGLLVAALRPPLGRIATLAKLDGVATYAGTAYEFATNRWHDGIGGLSGERYLESFALDGTIPTWTYAFADALLEQRIWMDAGANTTYVRYTLRRASAPFSLALLALAEQRDFHALTHAYDAQPAESVFEGVRFAPFAGAVPLVVRAPGASVTPRNEWYYGFRYELEAERGLDSEGDLLHIADVEGALHAGESLEIVVSVEPEPSLDVAAALARRRDADAALVRATPKDAPPWIRTLVVAADAFVADRPSDGDAHAKTVIAGYPWFGDWGRDTMIALHGLTLTTGRAETARSILRTFARYVDGGMIPNRFPEAGEAPEYNTVDATLWYVEALRAYHAATGDEQLVDELFPVLGRIVDAHVAGTRYGIRVDPSDGLLRAGEPGVQLTWMDAKVGDWVVTPRIGKPVEVNALWYNALRSIEAFARSRDGAHRYAQLADRAAEGFRRFWNGSRGYCFDVLDGPDGDDASLRPNAILAVALAHPVLDEEHWRAVVDGCARTLLASPGLRTLEPGDPRYVGTYGGDQHARDAAYHQGTVWTWLLGPFVVSHLRVHRDAAAARRILEPIRHLLTDDGIGTLGEIYDGDPPFTPRGCFAQAWSVAEVLRAWDAIATFEQTGRIVA